MEGATRSTTPPPPQSNLESGRPALFAEDTCEFLQGSQDSPLLSYGPNGRIIGLIHKTWRDIEGSDHVDYSRFCIPGKAVTAKNFAAFRRTAQIPRHHILFIPCFPGSPPMLVHESELKQVDRCFTFGDFVKRDLASALSGTVISVSVSVGLQHCYDFETPGHSGPIVHNIPNSDLVKVSEFKPQQFVIYQGTWMGVIEDVYEDVSLRLQNGSVVMVHDPLALEIPPQSWSTDSNAGRAETAGENEAQGYNNLFPNAAGPIAPAVRIAPPRPIPVCPRTIGMMVKTAKSNLRKGRWLFGSYNPSIPPIGQIVEAKISRISVNWLYQNMMVAGPFVQKPAPERWLEGDEEMSQLAIFQKSFSGLCKLDGTPFSNISECGGAGEELQVGAAVRFHNIDDAVRKYGVRKIRRSEAMGFDLNSFLITETRTTVRVQWQDLTETVEDACQLMPYLNVDEHEVWPGEIVIVKEPDTASLSITRNGRASAIMKPNNVGVVQSVDAERVARIRWYAEPRVLIQEGAMVPGSKPGQLSEEAEEASLYEVIAHQAFAVRRGDYVLITPEKFNDLRRVGTISLGARRRGTATIQALDGSEIRLSPSDTLQLPGEGQGNLNEQVRDTTERGLLPRSGVAPPDAVPTTFPQGPDDIQPEPAPSEPTSSEPVNVPLVEPHVYEPLELIGEVIDLGTDGLITVRLSAMTELRDVKVFIERLHVIFNASSPVDIEDDDDDDDDDEYDSDTDDDDSDAWAGDAMVIEQQIFYEGGERVANDGGEEDWLTDDEGRGMDIDDDDDDSDSEGMPDLVDVLQKEPAQDIEIEVTGGINIEVIEMDSMEMVEKVDGGKDDVRLKEMEPEEVAAVPEEQPALAAFSIPTAKNQPERFAVLGTAVPSDHAFASQAPVPLRPAFARRINKEHQVLSTSLPDGVFVRTFESRLDLMRVLIIGPLDTPYELAPFVFDFYFPATFPHTPPRAYFHSWTAGIGRVNPNLYEDGKICLSLLGTWHAERKAEGWSVGSSILQLLVSLMGLVLVREPYYNEAGFSIFTGTPEAALNSRLYSEKAYALSRRFVNHALENPVSGLEEEIKWLYFGGPGGAGLLKQLIQVTRAAIERTSTLVAEGSENDADVANEGSVRFSGGALVLLRKSLASYEKIWEKFVEDNAGTVIESLRVGEVPAGSTS